MPPRLLFADTFYWIALLNPRDAFHTVALSYAGRIEGHSHALLPIRMRAPSGSERSAASSARRIGPPHSTAAQTFRVSK
jgi:hypothetical protein